MILQKYVYSFHMNRAITIHYWKRTRSASSLDTECRGVSPALGCDPSSGLILLEHSLPDASALACLERLPFLQPWAQCSFQSLGLPFILSNATEPAHKDLCPLMHSCAGAPCSP